MNSTGMLSCYLRYCCLFLAPHTWELYTLRVVQGRRGHTLATDHFITTGNAVFLRTLINTNLLILAQ